MLYPRDLDISYVNLSFMIYAPAKLYNSYVLVLCRLLKMNVQICQILLEVIFYKYFVSLLIVDIDLDLEYSYSRSYLSFMNCPLSAHCFYVLYLCLFNIPLGQVIFDCSPLYQQSSQNFQF